jgi:3-methyladenine DNA glycosylase AlkD
MSEAAAEADAFVSAHLEQARRLGEQLADLSEEPDAFVEALRAGLEALADASYLEMVTRACPETPARFAVRGPLSRALMKPVEAALAESSSVSALRLAQKLSRAEHRDLRLYAQPCLRRALPQDPELSWQLMRQLGRSAGDWIAVDSLADVWARGVLAEPFRWAELEQLLYSEHTYERRLVPATLATMPHRVPKARHQELRGGSSQRAMDIVSLLIGDAEEMVQKALSWAIREWTRVDAMATAELLRAETILASEHRDGARAWVIRDSLSKQPQGLAGELREQLAGIRRDRRTASTSIAAGQAASFAAALASSHEAVAVQGDRYTRSRA